MRRPTKFAVRSASVAALLALSLVVPAQARDDSHCVTPKGTLHSSPASLDGSLRTFTGHVSHFGQITGCLLLNFDYSNPPLVTFTGQLAFVAKKDMVYGTVQGYFTSANTYVETLTITGGTGKYAGISGYATPVFGTLDFTNGTGVDMIDGGQICLP